MVYLHDTQVLLKFGGSDGRRMGRASVNTLVDAKYYKAKAAIRKLLEGIPLALTSDMWSSLAKQAFMAVTAHGITEEWELVQVSFNCADLSPLS